jgi:medium-chain acyl-[acyl-carrier-protein] hydrolase
LPDFKPIFENTLRVNAFECDINRRWKPSAFFQHLTETAGRHADHLGCGFETMFSQNLYWVHSRMKIKFLRFPMDGEQITITTWPKTIQQKLFFVRDYEVHTATGEKLAAASSAWLIINASTRRMVPPQSTSLKLPRLPEKAALEEPLERLSIPDGGEERENLRAGYSAIDMLGHVNNSRYVDWICDAFPMETYQQHCLDWMQINYDKEIRPGEGVSVIYQTSDTDPAVSWIKGQNLTNQTPAFEAVLKWKE